MSPSELLDSLIEEHGWEGILTALMQIADRDDFEIVATGLRSLLTLIAD